MWIKQNLRMNRWWIHQVCRSPVDARRQRAVHLRSRRLTGSRRSCSRSAWRVCLFSLSLFPSLTSHTHRLALFSKSGPLQSLDTVQWAQNLDAKSRWKRRLPCCIVRCKTENDWFRVCMCVCVSALGDCLSVWSPLYHFYPGVNRPWLLSLMFFVKVRL